MVRRIFGRGDFGYNIGEVSQGCKICFSGSSIVIFVTGLCRDSCFYCPISYRKRGKDLTYVNDESVTTIDEIILEAHHIKARGAALTGGDPLLALTKTIGIIEALKNEFGEKFYIHLYTSGRYADRETLKLLEKAGLDEIRFHPVDKKYLKRIEIAVKETSMKVGIEVPAIPGRIEWLKELALFLENIGGDFININELEVSEANINNMISRGYRISKNGISIEGSYETALEFLNWAKENLNRIAVRFCPAIYKDKFQLRNRLLRKASIIGKPYEELTPSGTLRVAVIEKIKESLPAEAKNYVVELGSGLTVAHPKIANYVASKYQIIEYYPRTKGKFIVNRVEYTT